MGMGAGTQHLWDVPPVQQYITALGEHGYATALQQGALSPRGAAGECIHLCLWAGETVRAECCQLWLAESPLGLSCWHSVPTQTSLQLCQKLVAEVSCHLPPSG